MPAAASTANCLLRLYVAAAAVTPTADCLLQLHIAAAAVLQANLLFPLAKSIQEHQCEHHMGANTAHRHRTSMQGSSSLGWLEGELHGDLSIAGPVSSVLYAGSWNDAREKNEVTWFRLTNLHTDRQEQHIDGNQRG